MKINAETELINAFFGSSCKNQQCVLEDSENNIYFEYIEEYGTLKVHTRIVLLTNDIEAIGEPVDSVCLSDTVTGYLAEPEETRDPLDTELFGYLSRYVIRVKQNDGDKSRIYTVVDAKGICVLQIIKS